MSTERLACSSEPEQAVKDDPKLDAYFYGTRVIHKFGKRNL